MEIDPENAVAYNNLGNILHETGHYADAQTMFEKAISLNALSGSAHLNLGETFLSIGR